jgi:hypothetical protein
MQSSFITERQVAIQQRAFDSVPYHLGWLILLSVIVQIPVVIAGIKIVNILPKVGWIMLGFTLPPALLLLIGGVGLVRRKMFGYYFVYAAILFAGIGGLKVAIIPELKMLLKGGFYSDDLSLLANLAVLGVLVGYQLRRVDKNTLAGRGHIAGICVLLFLGAISLGAGRALVDKEKGTTPRIDSIPYVGSALASFKVTEPVQYYLVYTRMQRGATCVVSGKATDEAVSVWAAENKLVTIPIEKRPKFLLQPKFWRLNAERFPTQFAHEDPCFIGRVKGHPRLTVQIGFRKSDQRFTAQLFGFVATANK